MLVLLGVAVVVVGFLIRLNPLLVIVAAVAVTGLTAGLDPLAIVRALGRAYNDSRFVSGVWVVLPIIGLLERYGLQDRARILIGKVHAATVGQLLLIYFGIRQGSAALGLASVAGQAQTVRPLVAPMAEAAAEKRFGPIPQKTRWLVRAHAAAADNIALFFGEDIFVAVGSILIIVAFMRGSSVAVQPLDLSLWAIPTALLALSIHGFRLMLLDRRLKRDLPSQNPNARDSTE
jgi:uncharacterized membrane protein